MPWISSRKLYELERRLTLLEDNVRSAQCYTHISEVRGRPPFMLEKQTPVTDAVRAILDHLGVTIETLDAKPAIVVVKPIKEQNQHE